ncbi:alpha/beta hydrolase [Deinococcus marmoris]|uniref:alpha/beta hydrolase n=1 Tax=Deinococcus marmoris TaxID=249408 RepID=UPI00049864B9|nr:alpha/beta hydrolase [Deinococcus marmoris]
MASQAVKLDVRGYRGDSLAHRFLRQEGETRGLGLILPGMGYGLAHAGLRYPEMLLSEMGFDTLGLETRYSAQDFQSLPDEQALDWLRADALGAFGAASAARSYSRVCIVGKSLGTLSMLVLLAEGVMPPSSRMVWLTPLLKRPEVRQDITRHAGQSLVVIGTKDPHYRPEWLAELAVAGAETLVLDAADHSFNVEGDVFASLGQLKTLVRSIKDFLER